MHSLRRARLRASALAMVAGLLAVMALAACNTPLAVTPTATPTPDAATILQRAATAKYQDVTFALSFSATDLGETVSGTGTGAITTDPKRVQMTMSFPLTLLGQTENLTIDIVTDAATNTTYSRISGITGVPATWTKSDTSSATSVSPVDVSSVTDFTTYTNAKVVGTETLNGAAVWHIQATPPADTSTATQTTLPAPTTTTQTPTSASSTVDIYIRQDDYYPQKLTIHEGGDTPVEFTVNFTKYNSGVTITLPAV